ncbi:hypothetical protein BHM03_00061744 [Ensete ventricosum]|nr:hypothetical protein BHM03_00061744 [Ensete ventricosum]
MRTRRGLCYPRTQWEAHWRASEEEEERRRSRKRRRRLPPGEAAVGRKDFGLKMAIEAVTEDSPDFFDGLPDDLVVSILCNLSASAASPSDLISVLIRFYCLQHRGSGASLMARAAMGSHAGALYSLAVIQFNGSGGAKGDKDLRAGVALCARAAFLGHVDALRELGHCLQDGYGVRRNIAVGRRFLVQANARELAAVLKSSEAPSVAWHHHRRHALVSGCSLLSDFGYNVPAPKPHPANRFMVEWFAASGRGVGPGDEGLRLCSHGDCGRPETRRHEFRRCSVCGAVNYCSRACQALHWKLAHKAECAPLGRWLEADAVYAAVGGAPPEVDNGGGGAMY